MKEELIKPFEEKAKKTKKLIKRKNEEFGVFNWLMSKHIKRTLITEEKAEEIIRKYYLANIERHYFVKEKAERVASTENPRYISSVISYRFNEFKQWFKENKNSL